MEAVPKIEVLEQPQLKRKFFLTRDKFTAYNNSYVTGYESVR
jgi:hypothetical protein